MPVPFSIKKTAKYHFIGIGGIGMSALAHILLDRHEWVQGSDRRGSTILEGLKAKGAVIHPSHSARHITRETTVVYSSAISSENPEFLAAESLGCRMLHRSELLRDLMEGESTVAVAGTHGKTTTTGMLTAMFLQAKLEPSFAIGGLLDSINGQTGAGKHFLFEADESDGSLLNYHPDYAIITNVGIDHLDHYKKPEALIETYERFASQVKKRLLYCADSFSFSVGEGFGFSEKSHHRLTNFKQKGWNSSFDLGEYKEIKVAACGKHNALNAAGAFLMALSLGLPEAAIRLALAHFSGIERRCQLLGEEGAVLRIDDYAHHPSEVKATLKAVKEAVAERRLVALFQPHRFCRTKQHLEEFERAFDWADTLYITDIFQAREEPIEGFSAMDVIERVKRYHGDCHYLPREQCPHGIDLRPHDVFITMGAGDIRQANIAPPIKRWKVGVLAGGRSPEHDVSMRSGRFVYEALDENLYEKQLFILHRDGSWESSGKRGALSELLADLESCEVIFPILHGPNGEDGSVQGFLQMLDMPFVGGDVLACSLAMNKVLTKKIAAAAGVPTPDFIHFTHTAWRQCPDEFLSHGLSYPVYVKAVHLGSSIGTCLVKGSEDLEAAIEHAFTFDSEVMIEEGKVACREFEFAALGGASVEIPMPGEKLAQGCFVDYALKYGDNPVPTTVEPSLTKESLKEGRRLAKICFEAIGMKGLARIDFLLDPKGQWWFFEMNAMPGMQPLSLFPKVWKREEVSSSQLMNRLLILALERARC